MATTLTLKGDPTGGSVTLDQHGLTDLKIYSDEALQEELTLPKTWTNGETSPTTLYMVGSSSFTNLQSAQGTLDLTYKANLAADGVEYSIKDAVGVTLLPIEFRDIKKHSVSSDDVQIQDWDTSQNIKAENIAWIEPHLAANDAPQMPQLEFAVPGMPSGWTIEAKIEVKYDRGNGARTSRNQAEDTVKIPSDGSFKQVSGDTWQIWSEYQNEDFFGGEATFTYRIKSGTTTILPDTVINFRIGGKNPDDAKCKAYIQGQPDAGAQGSLWFAYAIAKHESKGKNSSAGTDLYNQFYELPIHVNDVGRPTWNNDGNDENGVPLPGGYGVFQITGAPENAKANIPRKQIWNWRENVAGFFAMMNHEFKKRLSKRFYDDIRDDSPQHDAAFIACPPPDIPVGTHTFPSDEAIWLTAYNGWGGLVKNRYVFDPNKPCGLGSDKRWRWNPPLKASGKTYIQLVEEEID